MHPFRHLCLLAACTLAITACNTRANTLTATAEATITESASAVTQNAISVRPTRRTPTAQAPASAIIPVLTPVAAASPLPECPQAPPTRLIIGELGRVLPEDPPSLNVRPEPSTQDSAIDRIPALGLFLVLDGPVCAEDYAWFKIEHDGREGWVAEGDRVNYYVEPYPPG